MRYKLTDLDSFQFEMGDGKIFNVPQSLNEVDVLGETIENDVYRKQENVIIEEDGIYQIKDNAVYPVAHPDLSTQPSILPQRFGNLDIKEVLIANGREDEIPSDAMILCAWSFNYRTCIPATCKKENGKWSFITENGFTPDFTLVRYVGADRGYYYGYEEEHDKPIPNNIIVYRATEKLNETTVTDEGGLHTNAFNTTIKLHTFEDGVGTIEFNGDVTSIGDLAFVDCYGLTNVTIPNSVTSIGDYAFQGCSGLTSITIPNSVTSIGSFAFRGCSGLTNITIGSGVTSIGYMAFYGCSRLTSIEIPNSVTSIGNNAFSWCSGLTNVTIPNSVTNIGNSAFQNCSSLTSITIPNGVTSIESYAFSYCGLTSITIGSGVTSIGSNAFSWCSGLTSITCNATTAPTISSTAFYNVKTGGTLTVPIGSTGYDVWMGTGDYYLGKYNWTMVENRRLIIYEASAKLAETSDQRTSGLHTNAFNTTIKSHTFENGVGTIEFNGDVTTIGERAFYGCSGLTSIEIPNSVTSIGNNAFSWCSGLTNVTIGSGVTSIEDSTFNGCRNLKRLNSDTDGVFNIPNNVTNIGNSAFYGCSGLTSIEIPNSVTNIGNSAFQGCSGLTSITIPNGVTSIGSFAFSYCGLTSVTIPSGVTGIGNYAFYNCTGLTSITIPNSVTSIGDSAFAFCTGLTSVTIPNSVTSIGNYAFYYCTGLTSITSLATTAPTIGNNTFQSIKTGGTLTVPTGSTGYDVWMGTGDYYLGKYNWTMVEQ